MQEDAVDNPLPEGRRKVAPRVCIADGKRHIRKFLGEALEQLGFITCECTQVGELNAVLDGEAPDLVVLGLSAGWIEAAAMLDALGARSFDGKVLVVGPPRLVDAGGRPRTQRAARDRDAAHARRAV
jgi:PleD family two-component response regulator